MVITYLLISIIVLIVLVIIGGYYSKELDFRNSKGEINDELFIIAFVAAIGVSLGWIIFLPLAVVGTIFFFITRYAFSKAESFRNNFKKEVK